jgi:guanosine-3',5'-bis(diphosphate) 3'-pyrophosphohydrolase
MGKSTDHSLWQQAVSFAARAHQHQLRKDGQTPYAAHPLRVALTVRHVFGVDDDVAIAAACLHDVIEDTKTDFDVLEEQFGLEVAQIVATLTKDARLPEREREEAYDEGLRQGSWRAKLLKLADVFDNYNDAQSEQERTKTAEKARRAIACAGDDQRLSHAIDAVKKLIGDR